MWDEASRGAANAGRFALGVLSFGLTDKVNGGIKDPTHEAIEVLFCCENCGRKFYKTYEMTSSGKEKRWGYYKKEINEKAGGEYRRIYETLEKVYSNSSNSYDFVNGNCSKWAGRFWRNI